MVDPAIWALNKFSCAKTHVGRPVQRHHHSSGIPRDVHVSVERLFPHFRAYKTFSSRFRGKRVWIISRGIKFWTIFYDRISITFKRIIPVHLNSPSNQNIRRESRELEKNHQPPTRSLRSRARDFARTQIRLRDHFNSIRREIQQLPEIKHSSSIFEMFECL